MKKAAIGLIVIILLIACASSITELATIQAETTPTPAEPGPCAFTSQTITIGEIETLLILPDNCGAYTAAPYASIVFAHGFSMFGFSNGVAENQGNGELLASWGYVVAVPVLPDPAEERIGVVLDVLDYLETAVSDSNTPLYQKIDTTRLAAAGYSLGGATVLAASARDARIKAIVALDPVYHEGGFSGEGDPVWDPVAEAPNIQVPTGILGAEPGSCNAEADYADIYPLVGATHKASYHIVDASHCVFPDPGASICATFCGASADTPEMTTLSQKYMTAWFNYYLQQKTESYSYLYGTNCLADVNAGSIQHAADTAPRNLTTQSIPNAIKLDWELYSHPIIAGYHIYRRLPGTDFPATPTYTVGRESTLLDQDLTTPQEYEFAIRSYDPAGNLHQQSDPVSGSALEADQFLFLPILLKE